MDPYLLRKGKAEISLKNSAKGVVRIRALDVNGAVLAEIPFRESKGSVLENIVPDSSGGFGIPGHVPIQRVGVEGFPCGFRKIVECGIN